MTVYVVISCCERNILGVFEELWRAEKLVEEWEVPRHTPEIEEHVVNG